MANSFSFVTRAYEGAGSHLDRANALSWGENEHLKWRLGRRGTFGVGYGPFREDEDFFATARARWDEIFGRGHYGPDIMEEPLFFEEGVYIIDSRDWEASERGVKYTPQKWLKNKNRHEIDIYLRRLSPGQDPGDYAYTRIDPARVRGQLWMTPDGGMEIRGVQFLPLRPFNGAAARERAAQYKRKSA